MSAAAAGPSDDLDIWEFVTCAKCHLAFSTDPNAPPPVPFWLTECGHIICNNHLNADQSCVACGAQRIQMAPLQRDMDPPMVEWFQPVNNGLDSVTNAVKFQFDMLASLVRYYKGKCIHQRQLVERIKDEATEARMLRKTVEELKLENHQLRQYAGFGDSQPSEFTNPNGKRPITDAYRPFSSSSSVATPLGPNRLTLPPGHQQPKFSQHISEGGRSNGSNSGTPFVPPEKRPGSSRFAQQFAYVPPETPHTYTQESRPPDPNLRQSARSRHSAAMPPPPTPLARGASTRFHPPITSASNGQPITSVSRNHQMSSHENPASMGHAPSRSLDALGRTAYHAQPAPSSSSSRFVPRAATSTSNQQLIPQTPSGGSRRFVPPASSKNRSANSRHAGTPAPTLGNHRTHFASGAQFG